MVGQEGTSADDEQDLPTVGRGANARRTRDSEADVPVPGELRVAGVDTHPHLDRHPVRPLLLGECVLGVRGGWAA